MMGSRLRATGLLVALALAGCDPPSSQPTVGAILSRGLLDGVRLALEEESETHGLTLDTILIPEGTSRTGPALESAARFLEAPAPLALVGHSNSAASMAAAHLYNEAEVVQIAPTSTSPRFSGIGPFSFRLVPPDSVQGAFLAERIAAFLPSGGSLALFYVNDEYGRGLRATLRSNLDEGRFRTVLDLPHTEPWMEGSELEFYLDAIEAESPDLLVWLGRTAPLEPFLRTYREAGGTLPILGSDALAEGQQLVRTRPWWAGVSYSDFFDPYSGDEMQAFQERFRARFQRRAGTAEILTYDAANLILEGVRSGATTGPALRDWISTLGRPRPPYAGVSGPIAFDELGNVERTYVLLQVVEHLP